MNRRALLATGLLAPALGGRATRAQDWSPGRPVRILLGFPPGGASDAALRILQGPLQASLGQPVVVENRAGAGGNLAAEAVARSAPDGANLASANIGTLAVNPALIRAMPFHPVNDLAPIGMLFNAVNVLVVPANKPYRSVADLVADARARPDRLVYGTGGVGSPGHLCGILLDHVAGIRTQAVPYRGGGPQVLGLLAGEQDFTFSPMGTLLTHIESGAVRPLAVTTRTRARELPEVPTAIEAGLPDFEVLNWDALLAAKATPAPIRARFGTALRAALADPGVVTEFRRRGLEPWASDEATVANRIAEDSARWQPLIRAAGIEPS